MKTEIFIVNKILRGTKNTFSGFIVRIGVGAVAISMTTMIVTGSLVSGFQREIRAKVFGFWSHLHVMPYTLSRSMEDKGVYKWQPFYEKRHELQGIRSIHGSAVKGGLLKAGDTFEGIALKGLDTDFDSSLLQSYMKKGHFFRFDSTETRKGLIISSRTAKKLSLDVGEKVIVRFPGPSIRSRPFRICGIYETGLEEVDDRYALTELSVIQELNGWGKDTVGFFEVMLSEKNLFKSRLDAYLLKIAGPFLDEASYQMLAVDPIDHWAEALSSLIENPELDVQTIKNNFPGIFDWLVLQDMNELIILSLMLLVAGINMMTCLLILIIERSRMIGLLKAMGANTFQIGRLFLVMGGMIVVTGLLLGNIMGLGICLLQDYTQIITLPKESYYLDAVPVAINWIWILGLNLFSLFFCTLILIIPAWIISRVNPVKVLRLD